LDEVFSALFITAKSPSNDGAKEAAISRSARNVDSVSRSTFSCCDVNFDFQFATTPSMIAPRFISTASNVSGLNLTSATAIAGRKRERQTNGLDYQFLLHS
jgi:hypothetical protein